MRFVHMYVCYYEDNCFIACGNLNRLSHGILWPITKVNETVEGILCSDVNPSFGFGPNAIRRCREDATWSRVDTSQCTVSDTRRSTIVMYSTYVEVDSNNDANITSPEIEQVGMDYTELLYVLY